MPDFLVEVHAKSTFGPFTYSDESQLKTDLLNGKLRLNDAIITDDTMTKMVVKEIRSPREE